MQRGKGEIFFLIFGNFFLILLQFFLQECNDGLGECVLLASCSNKTEFSDGSGLISSRFDLGDEEVADGCHYLQTCCDPENIITEKESRIGIVESINANAIDACTQQCKMPETPKSPPKFERFIEEPVTTSEAFPTSTFCGFRNKHGVGLEMTSKSDVAQFGEFPWMVALTDSKQYICGGSLIHPAVVLTGAHCVHSRDKVNLVVRVGEWDTQTTNEPFPHSDHNVKTIITHPEYNRQNLFNNVALLVLQHPAQISAHVNTVCLPPKNFRFKDIKCFGTGWGADNYEKKGAYRANLKKLELPYVQLKACQDRLRKTSLGPLFKIDTSFMCAGGEAHVDTCVGESKHYAGDKMRALSNIFVFKR